MTVRGLGSHLGVLPLTPVLYRRPWRGQAPASRPTSLLGNLCGAAPSSSFTSSSSPSKHYKAWPIESPPRPPVVVIGKGREGEGGIGRGPGWAQGPLVIYSPHNKISLSPLDPFVRALNQICGTIRGGTKTTVDAKCLWGRTGRAPTACRLQPPCKLPQSANCSSGFVSGKEIIFRPISKHTAGRRFNNSLGPSWESIERDAHRPSLIPSPRQL